MGNAGITLRKLEFDEIVNRWDELKILSKKALNDEKNVTGLGDRFEVAISRFFLLCEQETAQIWISQENGIDCYLCLTFVGNSAMTFDKGLTIYAATKFKNANVKDKQKHWLFFLNGVCDFAKSKKCKKISFESDLDYFHDLFKKTPLPYSYTMRNSLRINL